MGLLDGLTGTDWNDPKTAATLQLAAGLLGPGGFGTGLSRGLAGYQGTMGADAETKLKKAQTSDVASQVVLRNLQAQQQQRMFDLQTPLLEEAIRRMQGQAPMSQAQSPQMGVAPGVPQAPQGSAPQAQPVSQPQSQSGGSMFPGVPDNVAFATIGTGGFAKLPELIGKYNEPTDLLKMMNAAGIDPSSPLGRQIAQAHIAKQNYVAPVNARPGSILRDPYDPSKVVAVNPTIPTGGMPSFDAGGNVTGFTPIPGAFGVMGGGAAAKTAGEGSVLPYAGRNANGDPLPVTNRTAAATQGATVSTADGLKAIKDALPLMVDELKTTPPGPARDALQRDINRNQNALLTGKPFTTTTTASSAPAGGIYAEAPMGAGTTANESAKDTVQNYNEMHSFATTSAPRNIGLLQTIQQLADKTMVGPGASKIQFVNGVLNTLGITPGADQAQNYQIMKKNLNMLVGSQRMGAAGGGSDALQGLLEAANPNVAEMNGPAAKEAAEELIAYNRMMMAKDKAMPNPLSVPTLKYQQAETAFGQFNDPRLWQLEHAQTDQERVRILSLMPPNDRATLIQKAKQARQLGILN